MKKYLLAALLFSVPALGFAQQLLGEALRLYQRRQIHDAFLEKLHLPTGTTVPGLKSEEEELLTVSGDNAISKSSASTPESEVHAAVNPTDTTNIVVGPIHLQSSMTLPIYYTKNFGQSWSKSTFHPGPYDQTSSVIGGGDPIFAYDKNGKLYMSWIDLYVGATFDTIYSGLYWAYSTNGGSTWTQPQTGYIGQGYIVGSTEVFDDKEWLAVDRSNSPYHNTLYVAWTHLEVGNLGVMVRRKLPGVDSMEAPVRVSDPNLMRVQYTSIGVDNNGGVHVTFMGTYDALNFGIYTASSSDGGKTFGPSVKISDADIPGQSSDATGDLIYGIRPNGNYPCPHLSIDTANTGNLYEVWCALGTTVDSGHGTDIFFSRSTNNGSDWSPASVINNDRDTDNGAFSSHFYPTIAVDGKGKISGCWYDRREDPNDQIGRYYIGQSTDQGKTWTNAPVASKPMDFSVVMNGNGNFGIGEYTQVLATPNYTIPVWTDGRDNGGNLRIYTAFLNNATSKVEQLSSVSEGVSLADNYPNPFSGSTHVSFRVASPCHASLYLTNVTGVKVCSLYNAEAEAGDHDFTFDGSQMQNGVYYLNLETDLGVVRRAITILH